MSETQHSSAEVSEATVTTPRLRVLHLGKYFPPHRGGMETYLRDLLTALIEMGVHATTLVHASKAGLRTRETPAESYAGPPRVVRAATLGTLMFTPISPAFPWQLWRLLRQEQPDMLHLHLPNVSAFWALLLPAARRVPWVIHWHADIPLDIRQRGIRWLYYLYRPLESALLRRASVIISTSPPYRDASIPLSRWRDKCRVVPLGLRDPITDTAPGNSHPPLKRTEPAGHNALRVLAVGRLTYYKGFDVLLDAVARCPNVHLDLVGDGELRSALQRRLTDKGLASRVTLHGPLDDLSLEKLWKHSDCLCLPSIERTEAFGMVLLEAMARSKPCIATSVNGSGMAWVVEHGRTGLVVPPDSAEAIAEAFVSLAADRDLLSRMGQAGRARFEENFRIQASAAGILRVYQQLSFH